MTHSLPTDLGLGDFDSAAFTDNAAVFHPFVFSTEAFVVIDRTEYFGTKKPVFLRFEGPIVDSLRFGDFPPRPALYLLRGGDADSYPVEVDPRFSSNGLSSFHD